MTESGDALRVSRFEGPVAMTHLACEVSVPVVLDVTSVTISTTTYPGGPAGPALTFSGTPLVGEDLLPVGFVEEPACANCADPAVQDDADRDGHGDACDSCLLAFNPHQADLDGDGVGDACDVCLGVSDPGQADADGDGAGDACDLCLTAPDPHQADCDGDGIGEACEAGDLDGDGVDNTLDTCPCDFGPLNADGDADGIGDVCDSCPGRADWGRDSDGDRRGDACDSCPDVPDSGDDTDGDGVGDACDVCPDVLDTAQADGDGDGIGDACAFNREPSDVAGRPASPPFRLERLAAGPLRMEWEDTGASEYEVHQGDLHDLLRTRRLVHWPPAGGCGLTQPQTVLTVEERRADPAPPGAWYFLVGAREGTLRSGLGRDSLGRPRPPGSPACP